jgi:CheY-like chemotaxis protein
MTRILLVHWNDVEARDRAVRLNAAGYRVDTHADPRASRAFRALVRAKPPDAIVVDLARLPAQGRDVAIWLRQQRGTRQTPLVFITGDTAKTAQVREVLPDAVYTSWRAIRGALRRALARPPTDPHVPETMGTYRNVPLIKKLGIRPGTVVALIGAPDDFEVTLGEIPDNVTLRRDLRRRCDTVIWFVVNQRELERRLAAKVRSLADKGGLWIAWPKRASGVASDLTQAVVRRIGLEAGLVDHKICAIDATWSGLRFVRRRR